MHRSKDDGTRRELFDPELNERAKERLRIEADLHHALERGEFELYYQPIISFASGRLSAFEALLRWRHPERGMVRPDIFIPIAEETGLIVPLGDWVLEEACRQMTSWRTAYPDCHDVAMAVNLSARQFESPDLVEGVYACLERTGLDSSALKLEMTESVVMARTRTRMRPHSCASCATMGVRLLIDDFGTGYSSLASLHSFPLGLAEDRPIVRQSHGVRGREGRDRERTILSLAGTLGMDVVAEGVETAEQLEMLRSLRCEYGQGYFFSTPIDGESAAAWIENPPRW